MLSSKGIQRSVRRMTTGNLQVRIGSPSDKFSAVWRRLFDLLRPMDIIYTSIAVRV